MVAGADHPQVRQPMADLVEGVEVGVLPVSRASRLGRAALAMRAGRRRLAARRDH